MHDCMLHCDHVNKWPHPMQVRVERKPKKKGYMRLHTNLGDLNLELHCDIAPRACENFMILADSGYYTGTVFHRSIKNFMIQVLFASAGFWGTVGRCVCNIRSAAAVGEQYVMQVRTCLLSMSCRSKVWCH